MSNHDPILCKEVHNEIIEHFYIKGIINSSGGLYVTVDNIKSLDNPVRVWQGNNIISARIFVTAKAEEEKRFDRFIAKPIYED